MKYLFLLLLSCCLFSAAFADDDNQAASGETTVDDLPFWSIAVNDFHAAKPRPLSVPGIGGRMEYYWYWTFKFRYRTNLEALNDYRKELLTRAEKNDNLDDAAIMKTDIERIESTIKKFGEDINAESNNPLVAELVKKVASGTETVDKILAGKNPEELKTLNNLLVKKPRFNLSMYITMRTDAGQALADLGSEIVRNLVERREGKHFYTTREIQRLRQKDVEESFDPKYGKGRWVNGIAVFTGMKPQSRQIEIRITDMGHRIIPTYTPGQLIYTSKMLSMRDALQPTMRRAVRFFYQKIGQSPEANLDKMQFINRNNEWMWVWPLQIYPGRFRQVEISRDPGIEGAEPIKRNYVYLPYFVWNNTHQTQQFGVREAGIVEDINWGGEKLRVVIYDDGGEDARWKSKVMEEIHQRQASGEEEKLIQQFEMYPVNYDKIDIKKYYQEHFQGNDREKTLEYAEKGRSVSDLTKELNKQCMEMQAALQKQKDADAKRKAGFVLNDAQRLFAGEIPAGQLVSGVAIMQWGVTDIETLIDELIARLQMKALLGHPASENERIYAAYLGIRKAPVDATRPWTQKAEPQRMAIIKMLSGIAEKDLAERNVTITDDDMRRYGSAAALGVLFNALAWERIEERAKIGVTDIYFNVENNHTQDSAYIAAQFQRYLPTPNAALPPVPDDFANVGTKEGVRVGGGLNDTSATGNAGAEDGAGDKKEAKSDTKKDDDVW